MNILIVGASGMIGARIAAEAAARGHAVLAAARDVSRIAAAPGVTPLRLDIADAAALAAAAAQADVIVGAVSPRSAPPTVDALTYVRAMIAAAGSRRLVVVGGAGTLNLPDGTPVADVVPEAYAAEARAMRAAYDALADSDADYLFFAPAGEIFPGQRTGVYRTGADRVLLADAAGRSAISAEDYAAALMDEVERPSGRGRILTAAY
jgi:putative NADH-flavin reductase